MLLLYYALCIMYVHGCCGQRLTAPSVNMMRVRGKIKYTDRTGNRDRVLLVLNTVKTNNNQQRQTYKTVVLFLVLSAHTESTFCITLARTRLNKLCKCVRNLQVTYVLRTTPHYQ